MFDDLRHCPIDPAPDWDPYELPTPAPYNSEPVVLPDHWVEAVRYGTGYQLTLDDSSSEDHWIGGPPRHVGAICPLCDLEMLLFLDLNLQSAAFPQPLRDDFSPFSRLPIYYCPRCPPGTMYRLISDSEIQALPTAGPDYHYTKDDNEETYLVSNGIPEQIERRRVTLKSIPEFMFRDMVELWDHRLEHTDPDPIKERRTTDWLGLEWILDLPISQFFGVPIFSQGHDSSEPCRNPNCPIAYKSIQTVHFDVSIADWENRPRPEHLEPIRLQTFARLGSDAVPELGVACTSVRVQICWCCLTIYCDYE